jgi:hypothetical protein
MISNQPPGNIEELVNAYTQVGASLVNRLTSGTPQSLDVAFTIILTRMVGGMKSLTSLSTTAHDYYIDTACILRVLYDLHIQFRYMLLDPIKHSVDYLNFSYIERYNQMIVLEKYPGKVINNIQAMPNWAAKRAELVNNFNARRAAFEYQDKKGATHVRKQWYKGHLDTIAKDAGMEQEYRIMHKYLSAIVHSSSLNLMNVSMPVEVIFLYGWVATMRVIGGIAKFQQLTFDTGETAVYEQSLEPLF